MMKTVAAEEQWFHFRNLQSVILSYKSGSLQSIAATFDGEVEKIIAHVVNLHSNDRMHNYNLRCLTRKHERFD